MQIKEYLNGIKKNNRAILAQAITLIESSLYKDKIKAAKLIEHCTTITKESIRIGISGTPGVGKSTFIEKIGLHLIKKKYKVAVLAIDPSSTISKGSILGDKTRMQELTNCQAAFIRPSPSLGNLGGVCNSTKDSILLCEAAGYDIIIIETIGVGQSESMVESLTDFFLYMTLVQNGDELQFLKKGVLELSDIIIINKYDQNKRKAEIMKLSLEQSLHISNFKKNQKIFTCSALRGLNIDLIWKNIEIMHRNAKKNGAFHQKRNEQNLFWLKEILKTEYIDLINKKINQIITEFQKKPPKNPRQEALKIIKKLQ